MTNPDLLNPKDAAEYIGVSHHSLKVWRIQGKGPVYTKPAHKVFYLKSDLDEYLQSRRSKTN